MSQNLSFATVDVFTKQPFRGNQLAIIHLPHDSTLNQEAKQAIAREFNLSETVFLHDAAPGTTNRRLETFTTTEELPFAGHPTIGTLCYICQSVSPPLECVKLITKAGPIIGCYDMEKRRAEAEIPHDIRIHGSLVPSKAVLSSQPELAGLAVPNAPIVSLVKGLSHMLVDLTLHPSALKDLRGQSQKIESGAINLDEGWAPSFLGIFYFVVVSRCETAYRIKARMLEDCIGEDAATGSAASCLAVYLALQDGQADRMYDFTIEQGVEMGRSSEIAVRVKLARENQKVRAICLGGSAVLVTEGILRMPRMGPV